MKKEFWALLPLFFIGGIWWLTPPPSLPPTVGIVVDRWQDVPVYSNGPHVHDTFGKSLAPDGYVYGWRYQCVEWIKRYYDQIYQHRMPDGSGNALDFWSENLADGSKNPERGLIQFNVPSRWKPQADDILIFRFQPYGHVSLVTHVSGDSVFTIQQNVPSSTRDTLFLNTQNEQFSLSDSQVVGWLRHPINHVY